MTVIYPIRTYSKAAIERRRLYVDYECWLEDAEKLTDFQVTIMPYTTESPIVVTTTYPDAAHKKLMMFVSGGVGHTNYTLQMVVKTDGGQTKRDDIGIRVLP